MTDLSLYGGRWVCLDENDEVVSVGQSPEEARRAGRQLRPKERLRLVWISPHPPHLALPAWPLRRIAPVLEDARVWLAGGAVRDLLLGRPVHDWDFAVAGGGRALARRVADALDAPYVTLDAERDTGRVVATDPASGRPVTLDFAALRGRSLEEDLRGRDFTINALALSLSGRLIDPTGGRRDLRKRRLRATGPQTFIDDPARLLRAVRVARALDFEIAPETRKAIIRHAPRINAVAAERVQPELNRILSSEPAAEGLRLAHRLGLLVEVLPEVTALEAVEQSRPHHHAQTWEHSLAVLSALEGLLALLRGEEERSPQVHRTVAAPDHAWRALGESLAPLQGRLLAYLDEPVNVELPRRLLLRWGALLHDVGKGETRTVDEEARTHFYGHPQVGEERVLARLEALRFPTRSQRFVGTLVAHHMRPLSLAQNAPPSRRAIYRFYRDTGDAGAALALLYLADTLAIWGPQLSAETWRESLATAEALLRTYFRRREEVVAPPPLLSGHDLLALGIPQGPVIGALLEALREAQAAGEVGTLEEARAFIEEERGGRA
jgi:putative nucleotidyltransferase with HDIG domain